MISEPPNIFGTVYMFDDHGPIRISSDGDQPVHDRAFAEPVAFTEMRCWSPDRVHISAGAEQQCVFYGYLEDDDTATVLPYHIAYRRWGPPLRMKRPELMTLKAPEKGPAA